MPFDLDRGLHDFVVVSSTTDDLQARVQEAIPATHRNCSNGIASQIERGRVGHERVADIRNRRESIEVSRALPGPINSKFYQLPRGRTTRLKTGQHLGDGPRTHLRLPKASQEVVKLSIRSLAKIFDFVRVVLTQKGSDFREG